MTCLNLLAIKYRHLVTIGLSFRGLQLRKKIEVSFFAIPTALSTHKLYHQIGYIGGYDCGRSSSGFAESQQHDSNLAHELEQD